VNRYKICFLERDNFVGAMTWDYFTGKGEKEKKNKTVLDKQKKVDIFTPRCLSAKLARFSKHVLYLLFS
jgi:hypothetical protein